MGRILEPKSKIKKIDDISSADIKEMHQVFIKYYNNADLDTFINDILKKQYVLLIKHPMENKIIGFSTIALITISYKGKNALGLFSGDTILEREFWGTRRWKLTWVLFCLKTLILNIRTPFFWFLISKGYKTYMLLANNFNDYYPRLENEDKELAHVVDSYCEQLFPNHYLKDQRILDFGERYQNLKSNVAEIDDKLRETQPKIRFFEERNPEWRRGTELPCVGVIDLKLIYTIVKKFITDKFKITGKFSAAYNALTR